MGMPACMEPRYGERCHSYGKNRAMMNDKFAMSVLVFSL